MNRVRLNEFYIPVFFLWAKTVSLNKLRTPQTNTFNVETLYIYCTKEEK